MKGLQKSSGETKAYSLVFFLGQNYFKCIKFICVKITIIEGMKEHVYITGDSKFFEQ